MGAIRRNLQARPKTCRSKVYVYYDEFKVIFMMLLVGPELRLTCRPSYALSYCEELNMKKIYQSY
jgi:hypothetical protein